MALEAVKHNDSSTTIKVAGRFDFSCHASFREAYAGTKEGHDFIIDMAETTYVDSAALGMLLLLREHAQKTGSRVAIANCNGPAREVLQIANFQRLFAFR